MGRSTIAALAAGVEGFELAMAKVNETRTALSMAKTKQDEAEDDFDTVMVKTFGLLVAAEGKRTANNYFPKNKQARASNGGND